MDMVEQLKKLQLRVSVVLWGKDNTKQSKIKSWRAGDQVDDALNKYKNIVNKKEEVK